MTFNFELESDNPVNVEYKEDSVAEEEKDDAIETTREAITKEFPVAVDHKSETNEQEYMVRSFSEFDNFDENYEKVKELLDEGWSIAEEVKKVTDHIIYLKRSR